VADQTRAVHEERIEKLISSAIKRTPRPSATNSERMAKVGEARAEKLEKERAQRRQPSSTIGSPGKLIPLNGRPDDDEYPNYQDELFDDGDD
jgi:hypothetical protein